MIKSEGHKNILPIECIDARLNKYVVRWGFDSYVNNNNSQITTFFEDYLYSPTFEQIQETVLNGYNAIIDERIANGFEWKGMKVWLSRENQFNYKAAYDLAIQMQGANLPITFKFGTTINPQYYVFNTVDELQDFYLSAMKYINDTLSAGWIEKDSIDWTPYINALENN